MHPRQALCVCATLQIARKVLTTTEKQIPVCQDGAVPKAEVRRPRILRFMAGLLQNGGYPMRLHLKTKNYIKRKKAPPNPKA